MMMNTRWAVAEARGFRTVSDDTMATHDDGWMPLVRMRE